ncbi:uncharacterized protein [Coffea arabica]|uniref:Endonuclease/exonuclease/phosphatase domain-containing protein n=1 Tax=Coffea arabica TaxID=13443 RepID=A0ABM4W8U4_COFAR
MKVLVWNCRGVGGPLTIFQLKEVINLHFPSVVFLAETKNQKTIIEKVQKQLKFDNCCVVNSNGKAGGLAMVWKEDIEVISIDQGTFFIGMKMKDSDSGCEWWLVGVYASTDENTRKWEGEGEVKERLDRYLANVKWYQMFDRARCSHIENEASDHSMLILDLNPNQKKDVQGNEKDKGVQNGITNMEKEKNMDSGKRIQVIKERIQELKDSNIIGKKGQLVELKLQLSKAYREEELYCSQKARTRWLQEEDKNIAFFHASVMNARKQRQITCLQKNNGQWRKNEQEVKEEICGYYK